MFLRPTGGGPAVRISEGRGLGLSEDGRWALVGFSSAAYRVGFPKLALVPTGAGETVPVPTGGLERITDAWHVGAGWIGLTAAEPARGPRAFVLQVPSGANGA